jgi:hypothetical protein
VEDCNSHIDAGTGTIPKDDGGCIPVRYKDNMDICSQDGAETVVPHRPIDHSIDQEQCHGAGKYKDTWE